MESTGSVQERSLLESQKLFLSVRITLHIPNSDETATSGQEWLFSPGRSGPVKELELRERFNRYQHFSATCFKLGATRRSTRMPWPHGSIVREAVALSPAVAAVTVTTLCVLENVVTIEIIVSLCRGGTSTALSGAANSSVIDSPKQDLNWIARPAISLDDHIDQPCAGHRARYFDV
jgi:hypothetical protein